MYQLAWRWGAFAALAILAFLSNYYAGWNIGGLAILAGVAAASVTVIALIDRATRSARRANWQTRLAQARLFLDVLFLVIGIHLTGGLLSPLLFLLPMYLFFVDLQSGRRAGVPAGILALVFIAGITYLEYSGFLPQVRVPGMAADWNVSGNPGFIIAILLLLAAAVYASLVNSQDITSALHGREASLTQAQVELGRHAQELDAQRAIGEQLASSLQLDTVLDTIAENARRLIDANDVHLFLYDQTYGKFGTGVGVWKDGQRRLAVSAPRETGLSRTVARVGHPILIDNVEQHPLFASSEARAWKIKSIAGFPIKKGDRVVGVLNAAFVVPHHFTEHERDALLALATQAALAIDNASLYDQVERRAGALAALYRVNLSVSQSLEPAQLMNEALAAVQEVMHVPTGLIMLSGPDSGELEIAAQRGLSPIAYEQIRSNGAHTGDGLASRVMHSGEPLVTKLPDLTLNSSGSQGAGALHTVAIIPLKTKDRTLGVLQVIRGDDGDVSQADVGLLNAIAQQIAIALENARLYGEARRRMEELGSLREIGLATTSTLQLREQLRALYTQVQKLIRPDSFFVGLYDDARQEISVQFVVEEGWELRGPVVPLDAAGLSSWVVRTRRPFRVGDLEEERSRLPVAPRHETRPARSWLGIPLLLHDRVIGILSVQSFRSHAFSPADEHFLSAVAQHAAIAIENARLYETTQRRASELALVNETSRAISGSLDLSDIFRRTVRGLVDVLGYQLVRIYLIEGNEFCLQAQAGYDHPLPTLPLGTGVAGRSVRSGQATFARSAPSDQDLPSGVSAEIAVPIRNEKQVIGVLDVQDRRADALTEEDVAILTTLGEQIGIAARNAELYQSVLERERFALSLRRFAMALTSTLDAAQILETLCRESAEFFQVDAAFVWEVDGLELVGIAANSDKRQQFVGLRIPLNDTIALSAKAVRERRGFYLNEAVKSSAIHPVLQALFHPQSVMAVPLLQENKAIGAFVLTDHRNPHRFGPVDLERVSLLANQAAVALANARLYAAATGRGAHA